MEVVRVAGGTEQGQHFVLIAEAEAVVDDLMAPDDHVHSQLLALLGDSVISKRIGASSIVVGVESLAGG